MEMMLCVYQLLHQYPGKMTQVVVAQWAAERSGTVEAMP